MKHYQVAPFTFMIKLIIINNKVHDWKKKNDHINKENKKSKRKTLITETGANQSIRNQSLPLIELERFPVSKLITFE